MKHLAVIQSEFLKEARNWDDFSYEEQKAYLQRHPKTKRKLTAKPQSDTKSESGSKLENTLKQLDSLSKELQSNGIKISSISKILKQIPDDQKLQIIDQSIKESNEDHNNRIKNGEFHDASNDNWTKHYNQGQAHAKLSQAYATLGKDKESKEALEKANRENAISKLMTIVSVFRSTIDNDGIGHSKETNDKLKKVLKGNITADTDKKNDVNEKNESTSNSSNKNERTYSPQNFTKLLSVVASSPFSTEYEANDSGITSNKLFGSLYNQCPDEKENINKIADYYEKALYASEQADNTDSDSKQSRLIDRRDSLIEKGENKLNELFKKYPNIKIKIKHDDLKEIDEAIKMNGENKLHD